MRILISILSFLIFFSCKTSIESTYSGIPRIQDKILIDGHGNESSWSSLDWMPLDQVWVGEIPTEQDFKGKYKLTWDENYIYVLAEIQDDVLLDIHEDGLVNYWDDDCLEIFIDENNSDGNHQFNNSAYAYHIALNLRVTDIGVDSLPMYVDHHVKTAKVTQGNSTTWEVGVKAWNEIPGVRGEARKYKAGEDIGFMVAYCDNDSSPEREHFIGSNVIEGEDKNRGWIDAGVFNNWTLEE